MSLSISGAHLVAQNLSADPAAQNSSHSHHGASAKPSDPQPSTASAIPTLTLAQRAQQLANSGLTNEQIATSLGVPLTQVLTSLHEDSPTQSNSADLEALSARLSIKV